MLKQCIRLLKHAMMLKQCLTLLKHSKTVVNTVWLKSEANLSLKRSLSCEQEVNCVVSRSLSLERAVSNRSRALWADLSLSKARWAVSKSSRALWADLSLSLSRTRCELWARVQEPCELISLSLERAVSCEQEVKSLVSWSLSRTRCELWARVQEPFEPSLSRMWPFSWEIGSQDPCSARHAVAAWQHFLLLWWED